MRLLLKDVLTNNTALTELDCSLYWWAEGNGSCDCNRALCFPQLDLYLENQHGEGICYGSKRLVAIDIEGDLEGKTKEEALKYINSSYGDSNESIY